MKALTASEAATKTAEALGSLDDRAYTLLQRYNAVNISDEESEDAAVEEDLAAFRFNLDILHAVGTVLRINCR